MAYTPPAYNNIIIKSSGKPYTPPSFDNIIITLSALIPRRGLYLNPDHIPTRVPDNLLGTGLKPLVLHNNKMVPRKTTEGTPLVLMDNHLTTLPDDSEVII